MMHIEEYGAECDPFDSDPFIMKLRDAHNEQIRRGICDDDVEITASVEGDHREDVDAFLSRPLRLAGHEETRIEDDEIERQFQSLLRNGW